MKKLFNYIPILAALVILSSCKKDNFDGPSTSFKGRVVYQGESIHVEQDQVRFQLWETGWQLKAAFDVAITQEGGFSAVLFDGNYKLVFPKNDGPFMTPSAGDLKDTQVVTLKGNKELDIEVLPYYMVRNTKFTQAGGTITSTVKIDKIITDANAKDVESVSLYINKTAFVGANENLRIARKDSTVNGATDLANVQLKVSIPTITPIQNYVYARVGVKISGVEDRIYSPIEKITF